MTAEELYIELKLALKFLDVDFGSKDEVQITVKGNQLHFTTVGRECSVALPVKEQA